MRKLCLIALAVFCLGCEAKYFATRCDLVHELRRQGFPEDKMVDWVCVVEKESGRHTDKMNRVNKDGSRDYGLFQINDKYWCSKTSTPGLDCNVTCADVTTDDITKASMCAKEIYKRYEFRAWRAWKTCVQRRLVRLPDITRC